MSMPDENPQPSAQPTSDPSTSPPEVTPAPPELTPEAWHQKMWNRWAAMHEAEAANSLQRLRKQDAAVHRLVKWSQDELMGPATQQVPPEQQMGPTSDMMGGIHVGDDNRTLNANYPTPPAAEKDGTIGKIVAPALIAAALGAGAGVPAAVAWWLSRNEPVQAVEDFMDRTSLFGIGEPDEAGN